MGALGQIALRTFSVEPVVGHDGQGLPEYGTPYDLDGRIQDTSGRGEEGGEKFVTRPDGSKTLVAKVIYLPPDADPLPAVSDRVTVDAVTFIVLDRSQPTEFGGALHHTRVRLGLEGHPS